MSEALARAFQAESPEPGAQWFAIWTHSQWEARVEEALRLKRYEVFFPNLRVASRRRDRRIVLARPLFPGYLFVRFVPSRETYLRVANTDGIVRILGDRWDALHPIADDQMEAVRRIVTDGEGARAVPWIRLGDRVRIAAGPLTGLEGFVLAARPGRSTFVISVDLLQRSVGVELADEILVRL